MPHVTIKLLGPFRFPVSTSDTDGARTLALAPDARLADALLRVELPVDVPRVVLLNGVQRNDDPQLEDGDSITVFPPIAGGCPEKVWIH